LAASPSTLLENEDLFLLSAWPTKYISYIGAIAVGLISALSCFETAPMILQAIAEDRAVQILNPLDLGRVSVWNHEPNRAIAFTCALVFPFLFVTKLDFIAETAAVCFLAMYASLNLVTYLQSALKLHTWRPHFRYYSKYTALLGTVCCTFIMFYMEGLIALVVVLLALMLFVYIQITGTRAMVGQGMLGRTCKE